MKRFILFAGCNGVGKSTLYRASNLFLEMPRVNMDEIVREIGSWKNSKDSFKAAKIAINKIRQYFDKGQSFNQEVTLCGKSIWQNIKTAKLLNYKIEMYYVGVDSVDIAKQRVFQRVLKGGHGIPEEDIERRYVESLMNLKKAINQCNIVELYDNSVVFHKIARFENGKCVFKIEEAPSWAKEIF